MIYIIMSGLLAQFILQYRAWCMVLLYLPYRAICKYTFLLYISVYMTLIYMYHRKEILSCFQFNHQIRCNHLSPAHEVGEGDIDITMSGRASVLRFRTISRKPLAGLLSYCIHTSLRGCRFAFWGL